MDLDTLKEKLGEIFEAFEVYIDQAKANQQETLELQKKNSELLEIRSNLENSQLRLEAEQTQFNLLKQETDKVVSTISFKETALKKRETEIRAKEEEIERYRELIDQQKIEAQELVKNLQNNKADLDAREAIVIKRKVIDRERKSILDLREEKILKQEQILQQRAEL